MSDTMPDDTEQRSTDPGRFHAPEDDTAASTGSSLGAGLALVLMVFGIPALLLLTHAPKPFPSRFPDKKMLTEQLSFDTLLGVLVAIVWIAWLFFVVCVIAEIVAARRGGLATPVPLGGPVQKLARVLVGALLLTGIVSGPAASAIGVDHAPASQQTTSATQQAGVQTGAQGGDLGDMAQTSDATTEAATPKHEITTQDHLAGHKVYTVAAPVNGYHDNLWDIASKHLGDGRRYKEIFELNKNLLQPDGGKLHLARLIQPGWHLVMPDDATGVAKLAVPVASTPTQGPRADTNLSQEGGVQSDTAATSQDGFQLLGGVGGIGLLAASALAALAFERRRRIGRKVTEEAGVVEAALRGSATPDRVAFLDLALRDLAARSREAGVPLPSIYAAALADDRVELLLSPANTATVGDWVAEDDGNSWVRTRFEAGAGALANEHPPYPDRKSVV